MFDITFTSKHWKYQWEIIPNNFEVGSPCVIALVYNWPFGVQLNVIPNN